MRMVEEMKKRPEPPPDDDRVYDMQVRICKAFAHSSRLRILDLLAHREYSVSELQQSLKVSIPNVSQHLSILKGAGVVKRRATRCRRRRGIGDSSFPGECAQ